MNIFYGDFCQVLFFTLKTKKVQKKKSIYEITRRCVGDSVSVGLFQGQTNGTIASLTMFPMSDNLSGGAAMWYGATFAVGTRGHVI